MKRRGPNTGHGHVWARADGKRRAVVSKNRLVAMVGEVDANRAERWAELMMLEPGQARRTKADWLEAVELLLAAGAGLDQLEAMDRVYWVVLANHHGGPQLAAEVEMRGDLIAHYTERPTT